MCHTFKTPDVASDARLQRPDIDTSSPCRISHEMVAPLRHMSNLPEFPYTPPVRIEILDEANTLKKKKRLRTSQKNMLFGEPVFHSSGCKGDSVHCWMRYPTGRRRSSSGTLEIQSCRPRSFQRSNTVKIDGTLEPDRENGSTTA